MLKILLIDDATDQPDITMSLIKEGHVVAMAADLRDALDKTRHGGFDWVVCHQGEEGGVVSAFLQSLNAVKELLPCRLALVTASRGPTLSGLPVQQAVALAPPFDVPKVLQVLEREHDVAPDVPAAVSVVTEEATAHQLAPGVAPFVGSCPAVVRIIRQVKKIAEADATVLLLGESGTGKELIAQSMHYRSRRSGHPLVPINCGAIPSNLLESELFGHMKGAFSGASSARTGHFVLADGGTVFLDEVGELPHPLQVKLLRVLQEHEVTPLGSEKARKIDVRVIAATNQELEQLVEKKLFREDLYYRLNVIPIRLPPLRERREDIPELLRFFIKMFNENCGAQLEGFTIEALEALVSYSWPGNIRELRNFVERLAILSDSRIIGLHDLPEKIQRCRAKRPQPSLPTLPEQGLDFYAAVDEFEKSLILQALERTGWNKNQAAALLSLNRTTLVEKLKKKGITQSRAPSVFFSRK